MSWALTAAVLSVIAIPCPAEKADREKPIQIESDRMEYDDLKRVSTFIGRVIFTRGTMIIRSDRLVVSEDTEGFQYGRAEGQPANFRQKREGLDEFIEGSALVIDHDGKAETTVLTNQATLRRLEREKVLDEVHGARITYLSGPEFYTVEGQLPGSPQKGERVRMVIQPRRAAEGAPGTAAPPAGSTVPLKPADRLGTPPTQR
jgi:lipopolysaccharide export system protein LptA